MSKRFIDTGIFDDDWFMDLSKDAKLLWVYFITKCDHAGILKLNEKLCRVQTDIKDLTGTIKQLGNRLVTVSEHLYFIPKFIEFQYPGFPNSKVRQQISAVEILTKYNLFKDGKLTLSKELVKSYENDTVNDIVIVNDPVIEDLYNSVVIFFDENCKPKSDLQKRKWCDTLDKLIHIDGYSPEHIQNIIKRTRMDDFWKSNFLSILKLRKKNKEDIMYFTVFESKIINNKNGQRTIPTKDEILRDTI